MLRNEGSALRERGCGSHLSYRVSARRREDKLVAGEKTVGVVVGVCGRGKEWGWCEDGKNVGGEAGKSFNCSEVPSRL